MFGLFKKQTVDGVLATFKKAVTELRGIAKAKSDEYVEISNKINTLEVDRMLAEGESKRAILVADKIEKLIS